MKLQPLPTLDLALRYKEQLPVRIRRYLEARGIPAWVQDRFVLGWNGERITIPVYDAEGRLSSFRLARDPENPTGPKMLSTTGARAEFYGWEHLKRPTPRLLVCEGEFDRLVLEARGFPAITSTGGAGLFREEWAGKLKRVPQVFLCFDRDAAGIRGAHKVAQLVPHARIVRLPEEVGKGGDVTDFFVRLGHTAEEFRALLQTARAARVEQLPAPTPAPRKPYRPLSGRTGRTEIPELKARIPLEQVVGRYVTLTRRGDYLMARCPFHEDRTPSFVLYPATRTFHCFGCGAHGDVFDFLMRKEGIPFREALERVRRLAPGP